MPSLSKLRSKDSASSSSGSIKSHKSNSSWTSESRKGADQMYSKFNGYGSSYGRSERTPSVSSDSSTQEPLAVRQQRAAKKQLGLHPIDGGDGASRRTSKSDSHGSKNGKLSRWFDMSSLATPAASYSLSADAASNDPNVYWDEEAGVWRYWCNTLPVYGIMA